MDTASMASITDTVKNTVTAMENSPKLEKMSTEEMEKLKAILEQY